eukprot:Em0001g2050a
MTDFLGVKLHGVLPWLIFYVGSGPAVVESNSTRTLQRWSVAHCELQNASVMLSLYVVVHVFELGYNILATRVNFFCIWCCVSTAPYFFSRKSQNQLRNLLQNFDVSQFTASLKAVRLPSVPLPVHSVDKKGLSVPDSVSCFRCGGKHYATTCKLKSVTCNNCGKTGHIAKVCRSNPTGAKSSAARQKGKAARGHSPEKENSPPREGSKGHSLYNFSSSSNKLFRVTLQVNGVNLPMEIDTGAAVSILSEATYKGKTAKLDLIVVSNEGPTLLGRACNGAAERAVQTLKEYLSKTRGDLETRLSRFLFQYRLTPHTSTGSSPAELLFGRRPKSHLDFIHPDLSAKVTLQQERQHLASESGASICAFLSGDKVYVRNFSPSTSSSVKWLPGVVTSLAGPRSVRVALEDGTIVLRHFDHVKFRLLPPPHPDQSSTVSTAGPSAQGLETCTTCTSGNSPDAKVTPDRFDAVSVQNVGSTYIIVSWDLPTHSNGILISFSLYCNVALAGVLPLTMISYNTTGLLLFTLYTYMYVFSATALPEISDGTFLEFEALFVIIRTCRLATSW